MNHDLHMHPLSAHLPHRPEGPMRSPAHVFGWLGIGLGIAGFLMPNLLNVVGLRARPTATRLRAASQIAIGTGLLTARDPQPWFWGRAAGDALDIATVAGGLLTGRSTRPVFAMVAIGLLGGLVAVESEAAKAADVGPRAPVRDYADRSGFNQPIESMRGAATKPLSAPATSNKASIRKA